MPLPTVDEVRPQNFVGFTVAKCQHLLRVGVEESDNAGHQRYNLVIELKAIHRGPVARSQEFDDGICSGLPPILSEPANFSDHERQKILVCVMKAEQCLCVGVGLMFKQEINCVCHVEIYLMRNAPGEYRWFDPSKGR